MNIAAPEFAVHSSGEPSLARPVPGSEGLWGTPASSDFGYAEGVVGASEPYEDYAAQLLLSPSLSLDADARRIALDEMAALRSAVARHPSLKDVLVLRESADPDGGVVGLALAADPSVRTMGWS